MRGYNQIINTDDFTVVSEYVSDKRKSDNYQSEAALEKAFIKMLEEQGYDYLNITNEKELIINLRKQLELLNKYTFSDKEWNNFFNECLANKKDDIEDKTKKIQTDYIQLLQKDDGLTKNIKIIDTENIVTVVS